MEPNAGTSAEMPVGTVTFLMTDIESSSQAWESDPGSMSKAVARHYEILDETIGRHGGARPLEQGEGDSVVAAFSRAASAVACALDIQRAMADELWPEDAAIRVRIGLHTGDARLRDEGNYFGETVVRCARLREVAHGGQVVLSRATEQLVVDHMPGGASLKDLGAHRLKDLTPPEQVYQLCHPALQSDFPPLKSLDALPNNLPLHLTSFIGREEEIVTLKTLMSESRLVTLTGGGGCGKTRLALQVAAELLDAHPDGAWWVDFAPLADPELVPNAVAAALSVREIPGQDLTETLVRRLREQRAVILLDNCEHLIGACAALADALLHGCAQVSLIATSREPLGVDGEISWRVPSLSLPAKTDEAAADSLTQCESVRLFVDRAVRSRPNFAVTNDTAPAVAEICHRLDGIPLALELAAARVRLLTPEQIVAGLSDRFRLLTGGRRTALPRQRTLEASVDWSYNLLSEDERAMLRRLSVFVGGFTLDAAEDVCAGDGIERIQVLDLLSSLVDRSLVQMEEDGTEARYRLLETIRAYARQKCADAEESLAARGRHLDHYLAFAERAAPELEREDQLTWLDRIEAEIDNLRAAMDWASESHRSDEGLRLALANSRYWVSRSSLIEAGRRLQEALSGGGGASHLRARALAWGAYTAAGSGDFAGSMDLGNQALAEQGERSDPEVAALALYAMALAATLMMTPEVDQLLEAAVSAAREAELPSVLARGLAALGYRQMQVGDITDGPRSFAEGLHNAQMLGDRLAEMVVRVWSSVSAAFKGEIAAGRPEMQEAVALAKEFHNGLWTSVLLAFLSHVETLGGDYASADRSLEEARSVALNLGNPIADFEAVSFLGYKEYAVGDLEPALKHLAEGVGIARSIRLAGALGPGLAMYAETALAAGDRETARVHAEEGVTLGRQTGHLWAFELAQRCLARIALEEGDLERAEDLEHEALGASLSMERRPGIVDSLEGLARIASALESDQEAARLVASAQHIREDIGYLRFPVEVPRHEELLARLQERLGDEAFDAAWAEGVALDLDAAVAYAERGRGERKRPSSGWASLTPAELDVVRFTAQGLTNPQIAERLFISRATVKAHLGHIFAKLGVATRAELAADATRRGV